MENEHIKFHLISIRTTDSNVTGNLYKGRWPFYQRVEMKKIKFGLKNGKFHFSSVLKILISSCSNRGSSAAWKYKNIRNFAQV